MVGETATNVVTVQSQVSSASRNIKEGNEVVAQATQAMTDITQSSGEIEKITDLIDGIAFQTNLLALNAGVEAARAGESGKGFAVVANEVRALAQRSAEAASQIKDLITTSSESVSRGAQFVNKTGELLGQVVISIAEIDEKITTIAGSATDQAQHVAQVNTAMSDLDRVTQQNAAMVEESAAASRSLASEASDLQENVAKFRVTARQGSNPAKRVANSNARQPEGPQVTGNLALAYNQDEDWAEF